MSFKSAVVAMGKATAAWTKNHKAELLLTGSLISLAGAVGFAIKGGVNTPYLLEDHKDRIRDVKILYAHSENPDKYGVLKEYLRTIGYFGIEFAPAIGFVGACATCTCSMYGTLKKEALTAWAAYTAICSDFRLYRDRVIEDKGEAQDLYYLTGEKPKKITVKNEDGIKEAKELYSLPDGSIASPYAFKFGKYKENGDRNNQWEKDSHYNMMYLLGQQDYLNEQLYTRCVFNDDNEVIQRGSVFLNEIRDLCGEDPIPIGQYVGNLFSNGEPGCNGFINFNIFESTEEDPETGEMIPCCWIDPNIDGMISDLIGKFEKRPFKASYYNNDGEETEYR